MRPNATQRPPHLRLLVLALVASSCEAEPTCLTALSLCAGQCRDLRSDARHCGACGASCDAGGICVDGHCRLSCQEGLTDCDGTCTDTRTDRGNCGACNNLCPAGEQCFAGVCALSCQEGLTDCDGACTDTRTDRANCGGCNQPCDAGFICVGGQCELSCQEGLTQCGGTCRDLQTDAAHCRECDRACDPDRRCQAGRCVRACPDNTSPCQGACADLSRDPNNCGRCGNVCAAGDTCLDGACLRDCGGEAAVATEIDPEHCGECGRACAAGDACHPGTCTHPAPVLLDFIIMADWRGELQAPGGVGGVGGVGGAASLSSAFQDIRQENPATLTLVSGGSFSRSPPLSAFFDDAPAIDAMNLMGVDANTFSAADLSRGLEHVQGLVDRADFPFVSSNLRGIDAMLEGVVAPYTILTVGGVRVALIGITFENSGLDALDVLDAIDTAQELRAFAHAEGARVFIALTTIPGTPNPEIYPGALAAFASALSGFHVIVGHQTTGPLTNVNGAHVIQLESRRGRFSRVSLRVEPTTGAVVESSVSFSSAVAQTAPDPAIEALIASLTTTIKPLLDEPVTTTSDMFVRDGVAERQGETALGNLVADALRAAHGTQIAIVNGGALVSSLPAPTHEPTDTELRRPNAGYAPGPPYDIVKADAFLALPYGDALVTQSISGRTLWQALENGVSKLPEPNGRFPQVSGFSFTYDATAEVGSRIVEVRLDDGTPIAPDDKSYTLTTVEFLSVGGDGYTMLVAPDGVLHRPQAYALLAYLEQGPVTPTVSGRIVAVQP